MRIIAALPRFADGKRFYAILALLLVTGIILRTAYLSVDAPRGFTRSQDVSTDPSGYTYFAENKVDYGDANPFDDPRWVVWEKSTQTVAALLVYSVFGTGRAQGNLTAVLLNVVSILLIALGIKNFGSRLGALFFALFASTSFTLTVFARLPFVEASQNLWLAASFYFFSHGARRACFYAFAGAATAAAAFFGKLIALYAAGSFMFVWIAMYLTTEDGRKAVLRNAAFFYGSYAAIGVFWFLFTYLPSAAEVSGYYTEQGMGLYGAPLAFQELKMFLWQVQNLLWERRFFVKLPFISVLAAMSGAFIIRHLAGALRSRRISWPLSVGWIVLLFWLIFAYIALFPFNYRPLRYQTTLMFPMLAMAGVLFALPLEVLRSRPSQGRKKAARVGILPVAVVWGVWFAPFICTIYLVLGGTMGVDASGAPSGVIYFYTLLFIAIGFCLAFVTRYASKCGKSLAAVGPIAVLVVMHGYLAFQTVGFGSWFGAREYSLVSADRDLGVILADDAVLSGSYGTALSQENKLRSVHHQFGLAKTELEIFRAFPITHLLIDPGNEQRAREDYPELMGSAELVTTYIIRGMPVKLYRISGVSPNAEARTYRPTDFEMMKYWIARNNGDSATAYMDRFLASGEKSYSMELLLAENYGSLREYETAIGHLRASLSLSPGDASVSYSLGVTFAAMAQDRANRAYVDSALVYLEMANARIPQNSGLVRMIEQLRGLRR